MLDYLPWSPLRNPDNRFAIIIFRFDITTITNYELMTYGQFRKLDCKNFLVLRNSEIYLHQLSTD